MSVRRQEIRREGADHVAVPSPLGAEQVVAGTIRDLIELAPEHGDAGFGVDAGGADVLMSKELLDVGDVHAEREQAGRHGVAQQVGIDAFADARVLTGIV